MNNKKKTIQSKSIQSKSIQIKSMSTIDLLDVDNDEYVQIIKNTWAKEFNILMDDMKNIKLQIEVIKDKVEELKKSNIFCKKTESKYYLPSMFF